MSFYSLILKYISGDMKGILIGASNITITGMNKLLQRLPDRNREEVSNQAIVLVQQLTVQNEEMKKTVVFNEVLYSKLEMFLKFLNLLFDLRSVKHKSFSMDI
jgi:hypothetical protein